MTPVGRSVVIFERNSNEEVIIAKSQDNRLPRTTSFNDRNDIDKLYSEMTWFDFHQVSVTKNKDIERKHI